MRYLRILSSALRNMQKKMPIYKVKYAFNINKIA